MTTAISVLAPPNHMEKAEDKALAETTSSASRRTIRRPTRGIQLKEDTFATLRVIASNGSMKPLVDAGSRKEGEGGKFLEIGGRRANDTYSNFLLQNISEDRQEKQQVLETFGEAYIFLFGQRARMMQFSGILANTQDFNWEAEWWHNYDNYLRGTKCVEMDAQVFLSFDDTVVGGYIIATQASKTANERNFVNFQFTLFVTYYANIHSVGNPYPSTNPKGLTKEGLSDYNGELLGVEKEFQIQGVPTIDAVGEAGLRWSRMGPLGADGIELSSALKAAKPGAIVKTWRAVQNTVFTALTTINGVWSGAPIRVPEGFEGTFAYDEDPVPDNLKAQTFGVVRFSSYAANDDEYVGPMDHYASSGSTYGAMLKSYASEFHFYEQSIEKKSAAFLEHAGYLGNTKIIDQIAAAVRLGRMGLSIAIGVDAVMNGGPIRENHVPAFTRTFFGGTLPRGERTSLTD